MNSSQSDPTELAQLARLSFTGTELSASQIKRERLEAYFTRIKTFIPYHNVIFLVKS